MLSTLVAFSDDDPSEEEGIILRKYYRHETAESAQEKLETAGYLYPNDLEGLKPTIRQELIKSDTNFQLRTIAVALLLAEADGTIDQSEIALLNEFAGAMEISLADARQFAKTGLQEIDETGMYHKNAPPAAGTDRMDLSVAEATVLLATAVSFADDDPTDAEAAVIREHFAAETVERAMEKMAAAGLRYPDDLALAKPSIMEALDQFNRQNQLKALAVAYKTAAADGTVDSSELVLIQEFCERYVIGMAEVKQFFKASPSVV